MFWEREDEDKRMVKPDFYLLFQNYPLWAHSLLMHGHSSWSTFGLHLVRCPKALWFLKESNHGEGPSSMIRFHAPCGNLVLRVGLRLGPRLNEIQNQAIMFFGSEFSGPKNFTIGSKFTKWHWCGIPASQISLVHLKTNTPPNLRYQTLRMGSILSTI